MNEIEHDIGKKKQIALLFRWNDALHRVEWWSNTRELWTIEYFHSTTVNIPFYQLVTYEDTWCEPCEGITDES